ncbi:hypothetical protein CUMW_205340 [Citrus unshiu]|uniref:Uncharacterized protein n=1 Tax=Citrus unshiu TaxID=55188 RepID=A0A2H5Q890_CITUN|nr:hypothetical protein CUMW_205340 [Citrus unshiu]
MRTHPDLGKCTVKSDALTRVLGKERLGRVRGFGFAATPSKLALQAITHSNVSQPESRLNDLHAKYNELQASFINYMRTHEVQNCRNEKMQDFEDNSQIQSTNRHGFNESNVENTQCKLLDWKGIRKDFGEGTVASTNPLSKAHHMDLGPNYWKRREQQQHGGDGAAASTAETGQRQWLR